VLQTLFQTFFLQVSLTALQPQWLYGLHAQFDRLLQYHIHALMSRDSLGECDTQRGFPVSGDGCTDVQRDPGTADVCNDCVVFMPRAIKYV